MTYYGNPIDEGVDPEDTRASDYHNECGFLWEEHKTLDAILIDPLDGTELGHDYECPKRLIIAGGRDYKFASRDFARLDKLMPVGEVVSGGAHGVDQCGEAWARSRGISVERFLPDWRVHGKAAGPIRNREMAEYATAAVLFPGGRGTESMRREAVRAKLEIFDYLEAQEDATP